MRILLIEDDLNFCETLRFQLEQEAYEPRRKRRS